MGTRIERGKEEVQSSIVEVDGLLLPDFDQDSASAWQTWELVDEWKMLLNRVDAIRQAVRAPSNLHPDLARVRVSTRFEGASFSCCCLPSLRNC